MQEQKVFFFFEVNFLTDTAQRVFQFFYTPEKNFDWNNQRHSSSVWKERML